MTTPITPPPSTPRPLSPPDRREVELRDKVGELVDQRFCGSARAAFQAYDADKDGAIDHGELKRVLKDARVGSELTRGAWAGGVMDRLDTNRDQKIQWSEFTGGVGRR